MDSVFAPMAGSVLTAATVTLTMAVPASAQAPTPPPKDPGVGAATTIACGISYPAKDRSGFHTFPATTVTLRSGPSNSCIQTGQGTPGQLAQYHCYTPRRWGHLDVAAQRLHRRSGMGSRRPPSQRWQPGALRTKPTTGGGHRTLTQIVGCQPTIWT